MKSSSGTSSIERLVVMGALVGALDFFAFGDFEGDFVDLSLGNFGPFFRYLSAWEASSSAVAASKTHTATSNDWKIIVGA
jgi:hypothetical protein